MLYGLEIFNFSNGTINELNIRQNILIKHSIGLEKFVKTTPLFSALRIKSIKYLVYQHKLNKTKINEKLSEHFTYQNDGMGSVDTIKTILNRFISHRNIKEQLQLSSIFLSIAIRENYENV